MKFFTRNSALLDEEKAPVGPYGVPAGLGACSVGRYGSDSGEFREGVAEVWSRGVDGTEGQLTRP